MLDALSYDLTYGSNLASIQFANSYWLGITRQIPQNQVAPHIAAFNFLRSILPQIFSNVPFTAPEKQQLTVPQAILENPSLSNSITTTVQGLVTIQ